jgi:hypothetical protein
MRSGHRNNKRVAQELFLEDSRKRRCPLRFASGGGQFAAFIADLAPDYKTPRERERLVAAIQPLQVDLEPLTRWANRDEPDPDEFQTPELMRVARRLGISPQTYFEREQLRNEQAWQNPQALVTCTRSLRNALQHNGSAAAGFVEQLGYPDLGNDLEDLEEMASWAVQEGGPARLVRT